MKDPLAALDKLDQDIQKKAGGGLDALQKLDDSIIAGPNRKLAALAQLEDNIAQGIMPPAQSNTIFSQPMQIQETDSTWMRAVKNVHNDELAQRIDPSDNAFSKSADQALQIGGGLAAGGVEWLISNVAIMEGAAYHQLFDDMPADKAMQRAKDNVHSYFGGLRKQAPAIVKKYIGEPDGPKAQQLLDAVGSVIDATVGKMGRAASSIAGSLVDRGISYLESPDASKESKYEGLVGFMKSAKPWAEFIAQFGTEYATFAAAHFAVKAKSRFKSKDPVADFIAEKVEKGEKPPKDVKAVKKIL